ncbi:MAG TPA: hypothetical protein VEC16_06835 [Alphaproteobacteria bacterium]|nr:hypothetical protein [Alphaproteobacteria bacterium]
MDSIDRGATIRIGFEENYLPGYANCMRMFKVPTYSLKIDKKTIISATGGRSDEYINIYENAAMQIATLMNDKGVKDFVIYNGEMIGFDKKWVSCGYIPKDGEEIFKKTLESYLLK